MSHADTCPCLHDTYVCLVPCRQCFPLAQLPDLHPEIRARHHEFAVKVEQLLRDQSAIDTHVWCESDGNNGVVPASHRVYEGRYVRWGMSPSDNPVCDGTRATHTPLYKGQP